MLLLNNIDAFHIMGHYYYFYFAGTMPGKYSPGRGIYFENHAQLRNDYYHA